MNEMIDAFTRKQRPLLGDLKYGRVAAARIVMEGEHPGFDGEKQPGGNIAGGGVGVITREAPGCSPDGA